MLPYWQHIARSLSLDGQMLREVYMVRRANNDKIGQIVTHIGRHPGSRPADMVRALDDPLLSITRAVMGD